MANLLGVWCMVWDGHEPMKVFVPAKAYTGETIPNGCVLWHIIAYMDGRVVCKGTYAVMHLGKCVGMTRIVCALPDE